jgi:hypothetical protein
VLSDFSKKESKYEGREWQIIMVTSFFDYTVWMVEDRDFLPFHAPSLFYLLFYYVSSPLSFAHHPMIVYGDNPKPMM